VRKRPDDVTARVWAGVVPLTLTLAQVTSIGLDRVL
jgi:hypothetical protein